MIPPVVQPGDVFQLVRMPNAAGTAGKSIRIVSVSGGLTQFEWVDLQPYSANLDRLDGSAAEQRAAIGVESFESVAANALGYPATITYNSDGSVNTVTYTVPAGTIVKTFSYSGGNVSTIVLSGNTPSGISLTKTLTYNGDDITGVSYS